MQKRREAPKDSNDSIFWKFWKTSLELKKIEALRLWGLPNSERPQSLRRLRPLSTLGLWELQNTDTLVGWELQNLERPQSFGDLNAKTQGGPKRLK